MKFGKLAPRPDSWQPPIVRRVTRDLIARIAFADDPATEVEAVCRIAAAFAYDILESRELLAEARDRIDRLAAENGELSTALEESEKEALEASGDRDHFSGKCDKLKIEIADLKFDLEGAREQYEVEIADLKVYLEGARERYEAEIKELRDWNKAAEITIEKKLRLIADLKERLEDLTA